MIQTARVLGYTMATAWCRWPMSNSDLHSALRIGLLPLRMCKSWRTVQLDYSRIFGKMNADQHLLLKSLWMPKFPWKMLVSFNNYLILQCLWLRQASPQPHLHQQLNHHSNFLYLHINKNNLQHQWCTHPLLTRATHRISINIFNNHLSIPILLFQLHHHNVLHVQDHHHYSETVNLILDYRNLLHYHLNKFNHNWQFPMRHHFSLLNLPKSSIWILKNQLNLPILIWPTWPWWPTSTTSSFRRSTFRKMDGMAVNQCHFTGDACFQDFGFATAWWTCFLRQLWWREER